MALDTANSPMTPESFSLASLDRSDRLLGAALAACCALVYLVLRPPLYDFDGYLYRVYAIIPDPWGNISPPHLLWNSVQILLGLFTSLTGTPGTVPFQIFGVVVSSLTLFCFYILLRRCGSSKWLCAALLLFIAFSPAYWFLTLENHPYPLAFLPVVIYFLLWQTSNNLAPSGAYLACAALLLIVATLFYQAAVLLLIPAMAGIYRYGGGSRFDRSWRAVVVGLAVAIPVLGLYFMFWSYFGANQSFFRWTTSYAYQLHPVQALQLRISTLFARGMVGFSGSLVQSDALRQYLSDRSPAFVLSIYGTLGIVLLTAVAVYLTRRINREMLLRLFHGSPAFAVASFSALLSWIFACAWEGITDHYWVMGNIIALFCLAMWQGKGHEGARRLFISFLLILTLWNLYQNVQQGSIASADFPDPLLANIDRQVGKHDFFMVLGDGVYGGVNYELLLEILRTYAGEPSDTRAVAILNDFAAAPGLPRPWPAILKDKIDSTIRAGGNVFVAGHLFNPDEYADLAGERDPFAPQVNTQFSSINGQHLFEQLRDLFNDYRIIKSDFTIETDTYYALTLKPPDAASLSNPRGEDHSTVAPAPVISARPGDGDQSLSGTRVAITIDDIPDHGDLLPDMSREDIARGMVKILKDNGIAHAYGFANGDFPRDNPDELAILKIWLSAGYPLGNHTFDHADLNQIGAINFIADISKQDRLLATLAGYSPLAKERRVFRYPYMDEGNTLAKRDKVRRYLASQGYQIAEVTADYDDWAWTDAYSRCRRLHDGRSIAWLKDNVVKSADERLRESNLIAERLFGRRIAQILLIHDGSFDVLTLDGILKHWRAEGVEFLSLKDALNDPVYRINPNVAYNDKLTFLKQVAKARHAEIGDLEDPADKIDRINDVCKAAPVP